MVTSRPDAAAAPVNWADAEDLDEIQYEDGEGPTDEKGPDVPPPRETITQDKDGNMITALEEWTVQDGKKIKVRLRLGAGPAGGKRALRTGRSCAPRGAAWRLICPAR